MREITVRFAQDSEGYYIRDLLHEYGYSGIMNCDWSKIYPYWAIAVNNKGDVLGCIQIILSYPLGFLEFLTMRDNLSHMQKSLVARDLIMFGLAAHKNAGVSGVAVFVAFEMKSFKKVLKRRWNAEVMSSGNLFTNIIVNNKEN